MANRRRRISLPFVVYVLILVGFVLLGSFVYSLASQSDWAMALGVGTISAFVAATGCSAVQLSAIRSRHNETEPMYMHPLPEPERASDAERYMIRYRGETEPRVGDPGRDTRPTHVRALRESSGGTRLVREDFAETSRAQRMSA